MSSSSSSSSSSCAAVCLYLTSAELDDIIASGGMLIGGPFSSEEECSANCCGSSSSGGTIDACGCKNVPLILHATFSGASPPCDCLNGIEIDLVSDGVVAMWQGEVEACNGTTTMTLGCVTLEDESFWTISVGGPCSIDSTVSTFYTCDPLAIHWEDLVIAVCCIIPGTIDLDVTA